MHGCVPLIPLYAFHGADRDSFYCLGKALLKVNIHLVSADREIFYAYCGNTAIDLDPIPVSRDRLTVVGPVLFE
jgi:hypothetical protein